MFGIGKFAAACLCATLFVVAAGCGVPGEVSTAQTSATDARNVPQGAVGEVPSEQQLELAEKWALRAAAANGDNSPKSAIAVLSTRGRAAQLISGDKVDTDVPVIVVDVKGVFVADRFDPPPGVELRGVASDMLAVFDLTSGVGDISLIDTAAGARVANLAELGPVVSLDLRH